MLLDLIEKPNDIKNIPPEKLPDLAKEIRAFLVEHLSKTGGHVASNLGAVELTMALHRILDFPEDKLIWDVGHQSYTHKILTGRKEEFSSLRQLHGLSGFPNPAESDCDAFISGHSSTSVSLGLGYCRARELQGQSYRVVSVIGDGAMTGGLAYEAINNAASLKSNFTIILNDNHMSISENVGGLSAHLAHIRTSRYYTGLKNDVEVSLKKLPMGDQLVSGIRKTKSGIKQLFIPGMVFEEMGIMYLGPVDGHDTQALERVMKQALSINGPVLVHVVTEKGKGYRPAQRHPSRFHGTGPFDLAKGLPLSESPATYTDIFSTVMRKLGDRNPKVVAVTAAMADGTGLKRFHNMFPERFFDVGIAEGHAVTFSAALAAGGMIPVFAVYSTFLQRAYDEIMHDVCITGQHVVFAVDRAGLVGRDGVTHQGIFDLSYLSSIPNLTVMAPKNKWELSDMLKFAVEASGPVAIRYPRGEAVTLWKESRQKIELGKSEVLSCEAGSKTLLFAIGSMVKTAMEAADELKKDGIVCDVVNARFMAPLDEDCIRQAAAKYDTIVTLEDNVLSGGFGEHVCARLEDEHYTGELITVGIPNEFVPHGAVEELMKELGMDASSVADKVRRVKKA
ncbi:1-deoxy-D-xylulose-5-phosphate synthase [Lachnospiraceae bacterium KHCPX20]|nr:1-deoxy-D-xylulose-5-phosphate synthase [Lachnospiraceae bacterium KHCPX20]